MPGSEESEKRTAPAPSRRRILEGKRSAAKTGMVLSMGALVATGLMRGRGARVLHLWSGLALIGLSYWHYTLYPRPVRKDKA